MGIVPLACSSGAYEDGVAEQRVQDVEGPNGEESDAEPPETAVGPVDVPYVIRGSRCDLDGCDESVVYSSVPPEERAARRELAPIEEFDLAQENNLASYEITTRAAVQRATALINEDLPGEMMRVAVYLPEVFFDFEQLRDGEIGQRESLWEARKLQLSGSQQSARKVIEGLGGTVGATLTLVNIVYANLPARGVIALLRTGIAQGVEIADTPVKPEADGIARRRALALNDDALQYWGWEAAQGARTTPTNRVRYAVIEADGANNGLFAGHWGFYEDTGAASRVIGQFDCNNLPCFPWATASTNSHGTAVTSVLLGDFEDGQDISGWSPSTRQSRGGIASEPEVLYYTIRDGGDVAAAIDHAVSQWSDIINMSLSPGGTSHYCSNDSFSGSRAAIQAAENAGVLVVVAAGNDGNLSQCRVSGYGAIPDTLTVGALEDVSDLSSLTNVPIQYYPPPPGGSAGTWSASTSASDQTTVSGNTNVQTMMVDVAVTGRVDQVAHPSGVTNFINGLTGTSFASPQVAGIAGIVKDWAYSTGNLGAGRNDPYTLRTIIASMADGANGYSSAGSQYYGSLDSYRGFGNLRATVPSFLGDTNYAHWSLHVDKTVADGDTFEYWIGRGPEAEPTQIKGWKFAALMDHDWYNTSPAITFQLIDKCPAGGGEVVVRTATRATHKARIRMRPTDMATAYRGRCLWMRAHVDHADATFGLYMVEYAYTNSRVNHDM